jgi:hypothetical protein
MRSRIVDAKHEMARPERLSWDYFAQAGMSNERLSVGGSTAR